ncbi:MAG: hypothetical protein IPL06_17630 [Betaproteobacteria bacterium]|nr:hypothetical protein [Betaproteobacteria bacterium]
MRREAGEIVEARVSMGAVSPFPARAGESERLLLGRPTAEAIREAAEATIHGSLPLAHNRSKTHLLVAMAERAMRGAVA